LTIGQRGFCRNLADPCAPTVEKPQGPVPVAVHQNGRDSLRLQVLTMPAATAEGSHSPVFARVQAVWSRTASRPSMPSRRSISSTPLATAGRWSAQRDPTKMCSCRLSIRRAEPSMPRQEKTWVVEDSDPATRRQLVDMLLALDGPLRPLYHLVQNMAAGQQQPLEPQCWISRRPV
jgi:hypothetical protein